MHVTQKNAELECVQIQSVVPETHRTELSFAFITVCADAGVAFHDTTPVN